MHLSLAYDDLIKHDPGTSNPALMEGSWGSGIGKNIQSGQEDWRDVEMPEIDSETNEDTNKRAGKKNPRTGEHWSDDEMPEIDYEFDVDGNNSEKEGPNSRNRHPSQTSFSAPKAPASKDCAAPSSHTRHHCILSGHIFRRERIPLRGDQRVGQRTKFDLEERRETCEDCKKDIVEKLWVCVIPICGRKVCGTCKRGWDGERAKRARESWQR